MTSFRHSLRRGVIAIVAVAALGGAAVGIAAAQSQPAAPAGGQAQTSYAKFVDALATRLHISTSALQTAIGEARTDAGLPAGTGFPMGGGRGKGGSAVELSAAATAIGITPEQLRTELNGKSLADVAQAHGKSAADVSTALKNAAHTRLDQAVAAGKLTADQANTQRTHIDQRIDQMVTQVTPQGGQGQRGGPRGFGGGGAGAQLDTAATAIGIPAQQLRTELNGKSLAEVAQAHGKSATDLATALKNAAHTRIDQAVAAGRLTADQANTQRTQVDQRIDQQINQVQQQRSGATTELPGG